MFGLKNLLKALAFILIIAFSVYFAIDIIQDKQNIMSFEDYDPPSSLIVVVLTKVLNTRGPIIQQERLYKIHLPVLKTQNMG